MKSTKAIIYSLLAAIAVGVILFYSVGSFPRREYGARDRGSSILRLSQLLKSYREINSGDPKNFHQLMEAKLGLWSDREKSVTIWPTWAAQYCGERPGDLQSTKDKIWDAGPYELYDNGVSEYIVIERGAIPLIQQRRFAIRRIDLEPALVHP